MDNVFLALIDDNNKIFNVLVFEKEDLDLAQQCIKNMKAKDGKFCNDQSAGVDGYYLNNIFYPPKPYESWIINPDKPEWVAPIPYPNDGEFYIWDENTTSWLLLPPSD